MSDTPTPETEANLAENVKRTGTYMVSGVLSRKLERERDALQAAVDAFAAAYGKGSHIGHEHFELLKLASKKGPT